MFHRLGRAVARHWFAVILFWIALVVVVRATAPDWDTITHDGDLAYLPPSMPSVAGERLLASAFPDRRAKSQIVLLIARDGHELLADDIYVAVDLARRFKNLHGVAAYERYLRLTTTPGGQATPGGRAGRDRDEPPETTRSHPALDEARIAFTEAIEFDEELAEYWDERIKSRPNTPLSAVPTRLAAAYYNRSLVLRQLGETEEADRDQELALALEPTLAANGTRPAPNASELPLLDVWTSREEPQALAEKLTSRDKQAQLVILQLSQEFMAVDNIRVLKRVETELNEVRLRLNEYTEPGLDLALSGSAAVGGDMLRSAADGIKNTEWTTVALVLLMLVVIYRSPLLVAVPLVSISVALLVAIGMVAMLSQLNLVPGFSWWELKVFTTTKIFIFVILFGSGTDFCLFLIARYREELQAGYEPEPAIARALGGVGEALLASALTTILGLSTMFFADFGKFRYSGPVIGLCLVVTLLASLTMTPALLHALGSAVFWPRVVGRRKLQPLTPTRPEPPVTNRFAAAIWEWSARIIVAYPGRVLIASLVLMTPLAGYGFHTEKRVTYDFLSALSPGRPSKRGAEILHRHFPVGESGPVTVLIQRQTPRGSDSVPESDPSGATQDQQWRQSIRELTDALYVDGVLAVRSSEDPLGQFLPGEKVGILSKRAQNLRTLRAHRRVKEIFVADDSPSLGSVARFEVILNHDPFSIQAIDVLNRMDQRLRELTTEPASYWAGSRLAYAGTTAGIRDLRAVTQADESRIKVLVVLAVLLVLLVILRRPIVSVYMIATVLFSYYVTIGATQAFFVWAYADSFQGLDWKVPLFLFVILVAIGQDYNVYLATRVFEEQRRLGPFAGLRTALVRTGGIITSCGVIMSGTFVAMTSGAWGEWLPAWASGVMRLSATGGTLRGIVELGFALSIGVMLDTLVVRTILVPAFLALVCRIGAGRERIRQRHEQASEEPISG